jgi:hypothetical protein
VNRVVSREAEIVTVWVDPLVRSHLQHGIALTVKMHQPLTVAICESSFVVGALPENSLHFNGQEGNAQPLQFLLQQASAAAFSRKASRESRSRPRMLLLTEPQRLYSSLLLLALDASPVATHTVLAQLLHFPAQVSRTEASYLTPFTMDDR